jgi:ATP-dependent RNA helicase SUPV3L1/SUV3
MLLGAETMRPMIRRLAPGAEIVRRERLSTLSYVGPKKLTKLPKRSAIVAFSAEEVYAIAELIRRQRGGAAVVMGALSPRTRNAQVALYQSGEVDFLVATDAIGMGLNMDVEHIAFASRAKFDGRRNRLLRPDEVAQIAGRAGRFRTDGTFGETGDCPPLDEETIARVIRHEFEPLTAIEWRSPDLDFATIVALKRSLERAPSQAGLLRARGAIDEETLKRVADDEDVQGRVRRPADVRRLWEVCQTPDFRKATLDEHARLVTQMAKHLLGAKARLPQDWIAKELSALDRMDGEIDTIQARLAGVRTWTYAANRPDWIDDCEHWRLRARDIEDRLSDALHALLTKRFIDRRTSHLLRSLRRDDFLSTHIDAAGDVTVEGHHVGRLEGLRFIPDQAAVGREAQAVQNAAIKALRPELNARLQALADAAHQDISLQRDGRIMWRDAAVARLAPGTHVLRPALAMIGGEMGDGVMAQAGERRLAAWLDAHIARTLRVLVRLKAALDDSALRGAARGLVFQLFEQGGALACCDGADDSVDLAVLTPEDRAALEHFGVRVGRASVFVPSLAKAAPADLFSLLWATHRGGPLLADPPRAASFRIGADQDWAMLAAHFYRRTGPFALRFSALETVLEAAHNAAGADGFVIDPAWASRLGIKARDLPAVLGALGYRARRGEAGHPSLWRARPHRREKAVVPAAGSALSGLSDMLAAARRARDVAS